MFVHFEARCTLDMILKLIVIKRREVLSFFNCLRETSIGAEFSEFGMFWKICGSLLVFTQRVSLYSCISLRSLI